MKFFRFLILGQIFTLPSFAISAECQRPIHPIHGVLNELSRDLDPVWNRLSDFTQSTDKLEAKKDEDFLIVPGVRAGLFELGNSYLALSKTVTLTKRSKIHDPEYEQLLPLGYVPTRWVSQVKEKAIRIAFTTQDEKASEIFVEDSRYHTGESIRVGSPESSLKRFTSLRKIEHKGQTFYQGEGITYVVSKHNILQIVVIRKFGK